MDEGPEEVLLPGETRALSLRKGEHLIQAYTLDQRYRWQSVIQADGGSQRAVLIELQKQRERVAGQQASAKRLQLENRIGVLDQEIRNHEAAAISEEAKARDARGKLSGTPIAALGDALAGSSESSARLHRLRAKQLADELIAVRKELEGLVLNPEGQAAHSAPEARLSTASAPDTRPPGDGTPQSVAKTFEVLHTADGRRGAKGTLVIRPGMVEMKDVAGHELQASCRDVKLETVMDKSRKMTAAVTICGARKMLQSMLTLNFSGELINLQAKDINEKKAIYAAFQTLCDVR